MNRKTEQAVATGPGAIAQPDARRGGLGVPMTFRRYLRLFLAVFLVVFLGGLGTSAAAALWSQSATTVATVQTGTWAVRTEGWPMPLSVTITSDPGQTSRQLTITWTPRNEQDRELDVQYRLTLQPLHGDRVLTPMPITTGATQRSVTVDLEQAQNRQWSYRHFRLIITPSLNGVNGASKYVDFELHGEEGLRIYGESP